MNNECSFEGCDKIRYAKGLCGGHYAQQYKGQALKPLKKRRKVENNQKRCSACETVKPLSEYWTRGNSYVVSTCIPCTRLVNAEQYRRRKANA